MRHLFSSYILIYYPDRPYPPHWRTKAPLIAHDEPFGDMGVR